MISLSYFDHRVFRYRVHFHPARPCAGWRHYSASRHRACCPSPRHQHPASRRTHVRFPFYPRRGSAEVASERKDWGSPRLASSLSLGDAYLQAPCACSHVKNEGESYEGGGGGGRGRGCPVLQIKNFFFLVLF